MAFKGPARYWVEDDNILDAASEVRGITIDEDLDAPGAGEPTWVSLDSANTGTFTMQDLHPDRAKPKAKRKRKVKASEVTKAVDKVKDSKSAKKVLDAAAVADAADDDENGAKD